MSQITIRNLSPDLERVIRRAAAEQHMSLNEAVQHLLRQATGIDGSSGRKRDLRKLSGSWSAEEAQEFEHTQTVNSHIDPELWK